MIRALFTMSVLLLCEPACAGVCGSEKARDLIDSDGRSSLKALERFATTPPYRYLQHNFQVRLSQMYEIDQTDNIAHCHGKMTVSVPELNASQEFDYEVMKTEDGQIILRQQTFVAGLTAVVVAADRLGNRIVDGWPRDRTGGFVSEDAKGQREVPQPGATTDPQDPGRY